MPLRILRLEAIVEIIHHELWLRVAATGAACCNERCASMATNVAQWYAPFTQAKHEMRIII